MHQSVGNFVFFKMPYNGDAWDEPEGWEQGDLTVSGIGVIKSVEKGLQTIACIESDHQDFKIGAVFTIKKKYTTEESKEVHTFVLRYKVQGVGELLKLTTAALGIDLNDPLQAQAMRDSIRDLNKEVK